VRGAVGSPPRQPDRLASPGGAARGGEGGGGGVAAGTVATGARALSLLCQWGVCRTKGEAADHWRAGDEPHVRVVLQARPPGAPRACLVRTASRGACGAARAGSGDCAVGPA